MATRSVETRDLKPGMVLAFTGEEVMTVPYAGLKTARGKVDFVVKSKSGSMIRKTWNRHTLINVAI